MTPATPMGGHTPGPWYATNHFDDDETRCNCASILDEGHAGGIATVHVHNGIDMISDGGNDAPPRAEAAANARLIAAAPELLEALDRYADELCEGWCEKSPDCAHFDDCAGCLARRTAYKARGVA